MTIQKTILVNNFEISNEKQFTLIAGPCAMESKEHCIFMATEIKKITDKLGINYIFKSSFDKANRTSIHSKRGIGIDKGIETLREIRETLGIPTTTDIHEVWQAEKIAPVVDIIQIPAFLCRQTDLLVAAAKTGKIVDVKKGQFLAPWDMAQVVNKLQEAGTEKIMLMERGATFGYNRIVVDPIAFPELKQFGYPVIFDATHSAQLPGGNGTFTGGLRQYIPNLAKTGIAQGIAGIFMEIHDNPPAAICDSTNQFFLNQTEELLTQLLALDNLIKSQKEIIIEK